MPLTAGTRLGSYEVLSPLGAGGMGEVYRARDTRLGREVAIKVLPELVAADADRVGRFEREAHVLASLNHPNIAQIYGVEDSAGGMHALVMELVEGQTLADRLAAGAIPRDEALAIAKQIIEALEAAHDLGIVHRDLKPANVKVRPDGTVKVLDFGLAKALDPVAPSSTNAMTSPTMSVPTRLRPGSGAASEIGMILGTAAYMSPEQARGRPVDRRSDIWAFGVTLFEMLAGRRPFVGTDVSDAIADILKSEPAWDALPADTPPAVRRLLRRCLQKDCRQRLQHIGDARLDIEEVQGAAPSDAAVAPPRASTGERLLWVGAIVTAAIATALATGWRPRPVPPEVRVDINALPTNRSTSFAISPDGRKVVFNAESDDGPRLWIRALDATTPAPLAGTESGMFPFWSPDSRSVGFFANNKLKRVDIDGGQPRSLANVLTPAGGSWGGDDTILFVPNDNGAVVRMPATGGDSTVVTPRRSPELATRMPQVLPDGRHFLFYVARGGEPAGVYVGELGTDKIRRILDAELPALFGGGHLFFVRERTLVAQRFDASTQVLSGAVIPVASNLGMGLFSAPFSISTAGDIAYRTGMASSTRRLIWFDRAGTESGGVGEGGGLLSNPSLSPDGRYVVVQRTVQQNIDLWSLDLARNSSFTRLTVDPGIDSLPLWSPDGMRIVFYKAAEDGGGLAIKRVDGTAADERLGIPSGPGAKIACDWSSDGRHLLYKQFDPVAGTADLWVVPMAGNDRTPFPVVQTPYHERDGQFSPDGKWIAYESDESGQPAIYLQPFPGKGLKQSVSAAGGTQVRWSRDGRELFYIAPNGFLMSVPIGMASGASGIGTPVRLFKTRIAPVSSISRQQYVVAREGQRFLMISGEEAETSPITLVLNWKPTPAR